MQKKLLSQRCPREHGQTMILVAISLVGLLAMAALAVDIVTLYVARSEIQRAADAAALAAAKAIADSGFTTLPTTDLNYSTASGLAQTMAVAAVNSMILAPATINLVGGQLPVMPGSLTFNFSPGTPPTPLGSYQVTVTLKSASLPTFFSKIWARSAAFVTASATAEAYNPANLPTTTPFTPIAPKSVKPWLVANADPINGTPFVDTGSWVVDSGVIGHPFDLVSDCGSLVPTACSPVDTGPPWTHPSPPQVDYLPAVVTTPNTPNICPACAGATDYENSIECADVATSYQVLSCGGGAAHAQWDNTINPGLPPGTNATPLGAECLIHASTSGPGAGQDSLTEPLIMFSAPYQIHALSGATLVSTSNSIVTIPIFDSNAPFTSTGGPVTVVGYLQAFINQVNGPGGGSLPPPGSINVTVLNVVGCSLTNNGANPVVGGSGTSPVPVRLIAP